MYIEIYKEMAWRVFKSFTKHSSGLDVRKRSSEEVRLLPRRVRDAGGFFDDLG